MADIINLKNQSNESNLTSWGVQKISIDDLIKGYDRLQSSQAKERYLKEKVKYTEYTNFEVACFYADRIIATSMFDKNGDIKVDSCQKYLQYIFALLSFYTNIDVHADQWILEFNKLRRYGLLEKIIDGIPEAEVNTLDAVLEMKSNDVITNYYNIQNWATKKLGEFYPFIAKGVNEILEGLGKSIENLDEEKIRHIWNDIKK
jgi:hypothetical protein